MRTLLCAALSLAAGAQTFEVASIKPNAEHDDRVMMRIQPGGRFVATGVSVMQLIGYAYNVRPFQVTGGPGWINAVRFDVNAKAEEGAAQDPEQMRLMMRSLLADRFKLRIRNESKEMPVYSLVVGKGGPKLTASSATGPGGMIRMGRGDINAQGLNMAGLAQQLAQQLGRTVIDKTGLDGRYDIQLKFTPEPGQGGMFHRPGGPTPEAMPQVDASGPTLLTAVQEQLGLKLESDKGPVPVIVIEGVDKPTEN